MEYIGRRRNSKQSDEKQPPTNENETLNTETDVEEINAEAGTSNVAPQQTPESEQGNAKRQREAAESSDASPDQNLASEGINDAEMLTNESSPKRPKGEKAAVAHKTGNLEDEINALVEEIKSGEVGKAALTERLQSLQDEIRTQNRYLKEKEVEGRENEDRISQLEGVAEEFEKLYNAEISKRDKLQAGLVQEIEDLKAEIRNQKRFKNQYVVSQCRALFDDYEKRIADEKELRQASENEITFLKRENDCLKADKKSQKEQIFQLKESVTQFHALGLENQELKAERNDALEKVKEYQDSNAQYSEVLNVTQKELFEAHERNEDLEKAFFLYNENKDFQEERIRVLEKRVREGAGFNEETNRLKAHISDLEDLSKEVISVSEHRAEVIDNLRATILSNEKNNEELRSLKAENERLTKVEQQNSKLKEELAKWKSDSAKTFKELQLQYVELQLKNEEKDSEIQILRRGLEKNLEAKAALEKLQDSYRTLLKVLKRQQALGNRYYTFAEDDESDNEWLQKLVVNIEYEEKVAYNELVLQNAEKQMKIEALRKEIESLHAALNAPPFTSFLHEREVEFSFVKENKKMREDLDALSDQIYKLSDGVSEIHRFSKVNEDQERKNADLAEHIGKAAARYEETADDIVKKVEKFLGREREKGGFLSSLKNEKRAFERISAELSNLAGLQDRYDS